MRIVLKILIPLQISKMINEVLFFILRFEISVADNGPGFDPDAPQTDDCRTHIGIQNVRDRLQHACSGALRIESDPATGTVVTIVIPKKQLKQEKKHADIRHRR